MMFMRLVCFLSFLRAARAFVLFPKSRLAFSRFAHNSGSSEDILRVLAEIKSDIHDMKLDIADLKSRNIEMREDFLSFRGDSVEHNLRAGIVKLYGEAMAESFCIVGLSGLARLVTVPKRVEKGYLPRPPSLLIAEEKSDLQLLDATTRKLITYIYDKGRGMVQAAFEPYLAEYITYLFRSPKEISVSERRKLKEWRKANEKKYRDNAGRCAIVNLLVDFIAKDDAGRTEALGSDSGLGMMVFTAACGIMSPLHELDLDCRVVVTVEGDIAIITVGEIKSSHRGLSKAALQLDLRLRVLETAVNVCYGDQINVHKSGLVFLPRGERKYNGSRQLPQVDFNLKVHYI